MNTRVKSISPIFILLLIIIGWLYLTFDKKRIVLFFHVLNITIFYLDLASVSS